MAHLKQTARPIRLGKRVGTWIIGHTIKEFFDNIFDLGITGVVAVWASSQFEPTLAIAVTFIVMYPINGLACLGMLALYDRLRVDWLGIETVKSARDGDASETPRFLRWILSKSDFVVFVGLSIWEDAGVTTAYLRKGASQYNGLKSRDWNIFLWSNVIATGFWTGLASAVVIGVEYVYGLLPDSVRAHMDSVMEIITKLTVQTIHSFF